MKNILFLVNEILDEKNYPRVDQNASFADMGLSSLDFTHLILCLETNGYNVIGIDINQTHNVQDIYEFLKSKPENQHLFGDTSE